MTVRGASLAITEIDGVWCPVPIDGSIVFDEPLPAVNDSKTFCKTIDPNDGTWAGTMLFDVAAALVGTPYEGQHVTKANLVFDNILKTQSEAGTDAVIDKKRVWITPRPRSRASLCSWSQLRRPPWGGCSSRDGADGRWRINLVRRASERAAATAARSPSGTPTATEAIH